MIVMKALAMVIVFNLLSPDPCAGLRPKIYNPIQPNLPPDTFLVAAVFVCRENPDICGEGRVCIDNFDGSHDCYDECSGIMEGVCRHEKELCHKNISGSYSCYGDQCGDTLGFCHKEDEYCVQNDSGNYSCQVECGVGGGGRSSVFSVCRGEDKVCRKSPRFEYNFRCYDKCGETPGICQGDHEFCEKNTFGNNYGCYKDACSENPDICGDDHVCVSNPGGKYSCYVDVCGHPRDWCRGRNKVCQRIRSHSCSPYFNRCYNECGETLGFCTSHKDLCQEDIKFGNYSCQPADDDCRENPFNVCDEGYTCGEEYIAAMHSCDVDCAGDSYGNCPTDDGECLQDIDGTYYCADQSCISFGAAYVNTPDIPARPRGFNCSPCGLCRYTGVGHPCQCALDRKPPCRPYSSV